MKSYSQHLTHLIIALLLFSCNGQGQSLAPVKFKEGMYKENVVLLDVRTPEEFSQGHIRGAVNIDIRNDDFALHIDSLDKNKTYFVYCKSGKRSADAIQRMKGKGFEKLYGLDGGIDLWKEKNYEIERN
jgi:rhodanese-related sulfurtransferase